MDFLHTLLTFALDPKEGIGTPTALKPWSPCKDCALGKQYTHSVLHSPPTMYKMSIM